MTTMVDLANMGIGVIAKEHALLERKIAALHKQIDVLRSKQRGLDEDIRKAKIVIEQHLSPSSIIIDWEPVDSALRDGAKIDAIRELKGQIHLSLMDCKTLVERRMEAIGIVLNEYGRIAVPQPV